MDAVTAIGITCYRRITCSLADCMQKTSPESDSRNRKRKGKQRSCAKKQVRSYHLRRKFTIQEKFTKGKENGGSSMELPLEKKGFVSAMQI